MTIFLIIVGAIVLVALIVYISNNKSRKTTTRYNRADEIQKVYDKLNREYDAEMEKMIDKFSHDLWSDNSDTKNKK